MSPYIQRRHLELIASLVALLPSEIRSTVARRFATELAQAPSVTARFDSDRFIDACLELRRIHTRGA